MVGREGFGESGGRIGGSNFGGKQGGVDGKDCSKPAEGIAHGKRKPGTGSGSGRLDADDVDMAGAIRKVFGKLPDGTRMGSENRGRNMSWVD